MSWRAGEELARGVHRGAMGGLATTSATPTGNKVTHSEQVYDEQVFGLTGSVPRGGLNKQLLSKKR